MCAAGQGQVTVCGILPHLRDRLSLPTGPADGGDGAEDAAWPVCHGISPLVVPRPVDWPSGNRSVRLLVARPGTRAGSLPATCPTSWLRVRRIADEDGAATVLARIERLAALAKTVPDQPDLRA